MSENKFKKVFKIVITGGPCAGKSTAMSRIIEEFTNIGYKVLVVPETATELIVGGIKPFGNCLKNYEFQQLLLKTQLFKEEVYNTAVKKMKSDKLLILYDRGALDGKAYITENQFKKLLKEEGLNEPLLRDSYDAVFHLITCAKGAEKYYSLENNGARTESVKKARLLDDKIISAWSSHPRLRIIDNSTDFKTKINRLMEGMYTILGEPVPLEIERKYLIDIPNIKELLNIGSCTYTDIIQTYLLSDDEYVEQRIRQRGTQGDYVYTFTEKRKITEKERVELETVIKQSEYSSLMIKADTSLHQIIKRRYCFVYNNQYFELDIYPFSKDKAILEIELTDNEQDIDIPPFIKVIKEVTEDESYKNHELAKSLRL